ncbi:MAG: YncE family protein [candidate division NC10 bacterium]|nr:YncE family protein [candidate division NC10 bacterium]
MYTTKLVRPGAVYAYAFNVGSRDVTIIDTATNEIVGTRPLGAGVRWLSNELDFWDGRHIWTYDLVDGMVELIAIEPAELRVTRRLRIGKGPAHSVMLTPDRRYVLVNAAGENLIAVVDRESLQLIRRIPTGLFPCDLDFTPDGKVGYLAERDQDTVAALDLDTFAILKRVSFPKGSKPHMLRVAPDGGSVWVQTAQGGTNDILDPKTLAVRSTQQLGRVPVTNAWTPDGRFGYITHFEDDFVAVVDAATFQEVKRIRVGQRLGVVSFRPDGRYAYVTVLGENKVVVIEHGPDGGGEGAPGWPATLGAHRHVPAGAPSSTPGRLLKAQKWRFLT